MSLNMAILWYMFKQCGILKGIFKKNMVIQFYMSKNMFFFFSMVHAQKHCINMQNIQQSWYYHGKCSKNILLPWDMS